MSTDARYIFHDGDQALILDRRGRRYLVTLKDAKADQNHLGTFHHDDIIGEPEGVRIWTSKGHALIVVKPGMADYIRIMPRIATVVYPKDIGAIITYGDIFPGARVMEAGTGSGASDHSPRPGRRRTGKCLHLRHPRRHDPPFPAEPHRHHA